jgi:hypothetical protein
LSGGGRPADLRAAAIGRQPVAAVELCDRSHLRLVRSPCFDWSRLTSRIAADLGAHSAGFHVRRAHLPLGRPPPPLPLPIGARFADWRWCLHARGKRVGLQHATRVIAHELQALR